MEAVEFLLCRLGFQQGGKALFPAHPPAYRGTWVDQGTPFFLQVHLLPAGCEEADSMRFFRTCLRADAELARAYVLQKRSIVAGGVCDEGEYCSQKAAFFKMVLG
jgi:GrpB-like predicted nucleotidyltransferase (UPF0157 family)